MRRNLAHGHHARAARDSAQPAAETAESVGLDHQLLLCLLRQLTTAPIHSANAIPGCPERLIEQAEFQVRVRIHQSRQQRHIAQIARRPAERFSPTATIRPPAIVTMPPSSGG